MKRRLLALLLAVLTLTMLTAAAFAEDTEVLGVYNVTGPLTVTNGTQDGGFYAGADTFELNCTGLTGEYSLVLLLAGDSKVPTSSNIQYIDQMSVEGGKVTIPVVRKKEVVNESFLLSEVEYTKFDEEENEFKISLPADHHVIRGAFFENADAFDAFKSIFDK